MRRKFDRQLPAPSNVAYRSSGFRSFLPARAYSRQDRFLTSGRRGPNRLTVHNIGEGAHKERNGEVGWDSARSACGLRQAERAGQIQKRASKIGLSKNAGQPATGLPKTRRRTQGPYRGQYTRGELPSSDEKREVCVPLVKNGHTSTRIWLSVLDKRLELRMTISLFAVKPEACASR